MRTCAYSFIKRLKSIAQHIGYEGQYNFALNFSGIRFMALPEFGGYALSHIDPQFWSESDLEIGPLSYEEINPEHITKDLCDRVWQAFGYEQEPFLKNGKFTVT